MKNKYFKLMIMIVLAFLILVQCSVKKSEKSDLDFVLEANKVKDIVFIGSELRENYFKVYLKAKTDNDTDIIEEIFENDEYYNKMKFVDVKELPKDFSNIGLVAVFYDEFIESEEIQEFVKEAYNNKIKIEIYNCKSAKSAIEKIYPYENGKGEDLGEINLEMWIGKNGEANTGEQQLEKKYTYNEVFEEIIGSQFIDHDKSYKSNK